MRAPLKLVFTSAGQRRHTRYTRWLIRRMDAVIATSVRSGSFLEVPHRVIMHGVDLARISPRGRARRHPGRGRSRRPPCAGLLGRVRPQKGTDLFVAALIELLPQFPDWIGVVTGRVTAEHQAFADGLKRDVAAAGLAARILFLGEVPDIAVWYRRLTLFVAPSRNEGFGLTPLEAMASASAVVGERRRRLCRAGRARADRRGGAGRRRPGLAGGDPRLPCRSAARPPPRPLRAGAGRARLSARAGGRRDQRGLCGPVGRVIALFGFARAAVAQSEAVELGLGEKGILAEHGGVDQPRQAA